VAKDSVNVALTKTKSVLSLKYDGSFSGQTHRWFESFLGEKGLFMLLLSGLWLQC